MDIATELKSLACEISATKMNLTQSNDEAHPLVHLKWDVLDSYVSNLLLLLALRSSGQSIVGLPVVDRLIECRVILEKMRTLTKKQEPQISRLLTLGKSLQSGAEESVNAEENEMMRPQLLNADNIDSDFESMSEEESPREKMKKKSKDKKVHFEKFESEDDEDSEENDLEMDEDDEEDEEGDEMEDDDEEEDDDAEEDEEDDEDEEEDDEDEEEDDMTFEQKLASIRTDRVDNNEEIESSDDDSETSIQRKPDKQPKARQAKTDKVYRPPKINPVYYDDGGDGKSGKEKRKGKSDKEMTEERFNRQLLQEEKLASLVEASDGPLEIRDVTPKELMERQRERDARKYEERNFIRIRSRPETKRRHNQMDQVMDLMEGRHDFPEASYMTTKKEKKTSKKRAKRLKTHRGGKRQ